jgi:predicted CopG family antitoxin
LSKIDDEIGCIEDYFWKRDDEEVEEEFGEEDEEVEEVGGFNIS